MMRAIFFGALFLLVGGVASAQTWTILKPDGPGERSRVEREAMTLEEAERGAREAREAGQQAARETIPRLPAGPRDREMEWTVLETEDGSGGRARVVRERATLEQALEAGSARPGAAPEETGADTGRVPSEPGSAAGESPEHQAVVSQPDRADGQSHPIPEVKFLHEAGTAVPPRRVEPAAPVRPYPTGGRVIYPQEPGEGLEP